MSDAALFGASCAGFLLYYALASAFCVPRSIPLSEQRRRLSWLLTTLAALVTTAVGARFAFAAWWGGTEGLEFYTPLDPMLWVTPNQHKSVDEQPMSRALCLFFVAYCVVDLVVGMLQYPDMNDIAYLHHTFYIALLGYLLHTHQTTLFAVCGVEELPTLIVGVSEVLGVGSNPRFSIGVIFFLTRVSYHLWISVRAIHSLNYLLYWVSCVVLVLHVRWFQSYLAKGTLPSKRKGTLVSEQSLWTVASRHLTVFFVIIVGQAILHLVLTERIVRAALAPMNTNAAYLHWNTPEAVRALGWAAYLLGGHFFVLAFTTRRLVRALRDVYTSSFIDDTIAAQRIIYSISWEDPAVERQLLSMGKEDSILTISSAGCNVLDYLIEEPKAIVACDLNIAQLAMLDLKLACIRHLEHKDFFALWAQSDAAVFASKYHTTLRPALQLESSRTFWDTNGDELFANNIFFSGTSGYAAKLMRHALRAVGALHKMEKCFRTGASLDPSGVGMRLIAWAFSQMWLWRWLAPLGGVPTSQIDLLRRQPDVWIERILECLHTRMWTPNNYFYHAYAIGEWTKTCCPRYMEQQHFAALRRNVDKVLLHYGPIASGAKLRDDFTVASLLDSMDWMDDDIIAAQLAQLTPQMAPGGKVFWRSFGVTVHSPVLAHLAPTLVPDYDRVGWYLSQWVAEVEPAFAAHSGAAAGEGFARYLCEGTGYAPNNSLADDAQVCYQMAAHALRTKKDVVAFYKAQGPRYDGFREHLLPGRERLMRYVLPWHQSPRVWISVGCGTARDLEYVLGHVKACGTRVYLLDLSVDLLAVAKVRVERLGLAEQVSLVVGDMCDPETLAGLPPLGSADLVTCSYCLTMIPQWRVALHAMMGYLKPGGYLALVDFTCRSDRPVGDPSQRLNQWWFANDGVFLNRQHTATLESMASLQPLWMHESERRVVYTPLSATSYLFVGRKR